MVLFVASRFLVVAALVLLAGPAAVHPTAAAAANTVVEGVSGEVCVVVIVYKQAWGCGAVSCWMQALLDRELGERSFQSSLSFSFLIPVLLVLSIDHAKFLG